MNRIPSFVFRSMAMKAIKPVMSVLIIAALLVTLPGLINLTVTTLTDATPDAYLADPLKAIDKFIADADPNLSEEDRKAQEDALLDRFLSALKAFWNEKGIIVLAMTALELLLSPALSIVLTWSLLMAVRKKELTMSSLLTPLRWCPKSLVVQIWMVLRICAWMLPGMAVMVIGIFIPSGFGAFLSSVGSIAAVVLTIRAALHYALAPIALAADPTRSPNGCIRASWEVMRNRKMELFMLELSFWGWMLLLSLVSAMLGSFGALGTALTMVVSLALSIYMQGAQVCFYEVHTSVQAHAADFQDGAPRKDSEEEDTWESHEL